jgi:hypothetical protein
MSSHNESIIREPLITGKNITYAQISDDVLRPVEKSGSPLPQWVLPFGYLQ